MQSGALKGLGHLALGGGRGRLGPGHGLTDRGSRAASVDNTLGSRPCGGANSGCKRQRARTTTLAFRYCLRATTALCDVDYVGSAACVAMALEGIPLILSLSPKEQWLGNGGDPPEP